MDAKKKCYKCGKAVPKFKARTQKGGLCARCYAAPQKNAIGQVQRSKKKAEETHKLPALSCVLVGDGGVGKTSLLTVVEKGAFPEEYVPAMMPEGVGRIHEGVYLELWDTASTSDFYFPSQQHIKEADVLVLCHSVASPSSLQNVADTFRQLCAGGGLRRAVLLGLKSDLRGSSCLEDGAPLGGDVSSLKELVVGVEDAVECSSKEGVGLDLLFSSLARIASSPPPAQPQQSKKKGWMAKVLKKK
eukprot:CAMPEP_0174257296 /NCGR_PEP_ID=MMETSP0439-20130205/6458_1 /TAXON_ID=0 /ORGANISM="Stereomyxa ramosa, Strain Chinc5" /LENGTH=244 /DNA_ID=CAMNT_0015340325 /DNA_START=44 /DNA_END=778 /DNA_ORIENTATION=+